MTPSPLAAPVSLAPPQARSRLSLRRLLIGAAVVAAVAEGGRLGWEYWTEGRFIESTDDAYVGGDITAIAPKVAGLIADVAVTDNQAVHAGDLLVQLDDRDYRATLARAEATVTAARASLANLDAMQRLQGAVIEQARADIDGTAAEVVRAKLDADRYRSLSTTQAASIQTSQKAEADAKRALASDAKARAALEAAQRQVDVIETQKAQARAMLSQALADVDAARLNVEHATLRAPIDGIVGNRGARVGAYASVGAQLLSIVPARGLWVDANFKENQLARIRPGQRARVTADVLPGEVFAGRVGSLAPATGAEFALLPPENATGNFTKIVQRVPVRILLDPRDGTLGRLRPGLSVTADVDERDVDRP